VQKKTKKSSLLHLPHLLPRARRGISFDKLGHFHAAIDDFNRVLQLEPNNSVAYFNRCARVCLLRAA
jgi:hypothetical protein